jgi:hypothetical protein
MVIQEIKYEQLFPTASFLNVRIGITIGLEERDKVENALTMAKDICVDFHKKSYPQFYKQGAPVYTGEEKVIEVTDTTSQREVIIEGIKSCESVKVLETYKLMVRTDEELNTIYRNKLIELSNKS